MFKTFDNCNMQRNKKNLQRMDCLHRFPNITRYYGVCGDGIKDRGEDCDCGFKGKKLKDIVIFQKQQDFAVLLIFRNVTYECDRGSCCRNCMVDNVDLRLRLQKKILGVEKLKEIVTYQKPAMEFLLKYYKKNK
ncbi:LOW QUALITY PROTEIN: hypothetical protein MXB_5141 [Myxobolus squamalis]|nr:LOW QUALITY PROTEIN: hypothetical protein MXB_5141 [Myxobolus squamalis]